MSYWKLFGGHHNDILDADYFVAFYRDTGAPVCKVIAADRDFVRRVKEANPSVLVVGRDHGDSPNMTSDPIGAAEWKWARLVARPDFDLLDAVEGDNEHSMYDWAAFQAQAIFDRHLSILAEGEGKLYFACSWSEGQPPHYWLTQEEAEAQGLDYYPWDNFIHHWGPVFERPNVIIGLHEYGYPRMFSPGMEGHHTLRFPNWYYKLPPHMQRPIYITECGIDAGVIGLTNQGWQTVVTAQQFVDEDMDWYLQKLAEHPAVKGATFYHTGAVDPDWATFSLRGEAIGRVREKMVAADPIDPGPIDPEPPVGENIITNPGFEDETRNPGGYAPDNDDHYRNGHIRRSFSSWSPNYWPAWWVEGSGTPEFTRPDQFQVQYGKVGSGSWSVGVFKQYEPFNGGWWQEVEVEPGATYRLSADCRPWCTPHAPAMPFQGDPAPIFGFVAVTENLLPWEHPNRAQDPITVDGGKVNIEPTFLARSEDANWAVMDWQRLEVEFQPTTDKVGVLLVVRSWESVAHADVYFDDVELVKVADPTPEPPDFQVIDRTGEMVSVWNRYEQRDLGVVTSINVHHTVSPPDTSYTALGAYHLLVRSLREDEEVEGEMWDGMVEQVTPYDRAAWATGDAGLPGDENWDSLNIAIVGDFSVDNSPTQAALASLERLVTDWMRGLPKFHSLKGHRDERPADIPLWTECPGGPWWETWRRGFWARLLADGGDVQVEDLQQRLAEAGVKIVRLEGDVVGLREENAQLAAILADEEDRVTRAIQILTEE
jgi:hypothetical protein